MRRELGACPGSLARHKGSGEAEKLSHGLFVLNETVYRWFPTSSLGEGERATGRPERVNRGGDRKRFRGGRRSERREISRRRDEDKTILYLWINGCERVRD